MIDKYSKHLVQLDMADHSSAWGSHFCAHSRPYVRFGVSYTGARMIVTCVSEKKPLKNLILVMGME